MNEKPQVPRITKSAFGASFHSFFREGRPVVLEGLADLPGAMPWMRWTLDDVELLAGTSMLPVMVLEQPFGSYERVVSPMCFAEFRRRAFHNKGAGFHYLKTTVEALESAPEVDFGRQLSPYVRRSVATNLWISPGTITIGVHFDPAENFNFQVAGSKTFNLYPPGLSNYYPDPLWSESGHISRVSRAGPKPDPGQFPRFPWSASQSVTLHAGEALYLPAYWWHQVESHGDVNINLNVWTLPSPRKQLRHPGQALRGYVGLALRKFRYGSIESVRGGRR